MGPFQSARQVNKKKRRSVECEEPETRSAPRLPRQSHAVCARVPPPPPRIPTGKGKASNFNGWLRGARDVQTKKGHLHLLGCLTTPEAEELM